MAKPAPETITLDSKVTTPDGVEVPITITLAYPKDQGLYAVLSLVKAAEQAHVNNLYRGLIGRADTSVLQALADQQDKE